ncbi:MAG: hypothetical protein IJG33_16950 [Selenomonadaceae bacterium]|nr:hypothetical protein [Selenomonadaceae bacterium]MBR0287979.1 hypothetical protein [Selenomonadaceae bacterium]
MQGATNFKNPNMIVPIEERDCEKIVSVRKATIYDDPNYLIIVDVNAWNDDTYDRLYHFTNNHDANSAYGVALNFDELVFGCEDDFKILFGEYKQQCYPDEVYALEQNTNGELCSQPTLYTIIYKELDSDSCISHYFYDKENFLTARKMLNYIWSLSHETDLY